eukprot:855732-Alexandrium_andersonii.AAC.1
MLPPSSALAVASAVSGAPQLLLHLLCAKASRRLRAEVQQREDLLNRREEEPRRLDSAGRRAGGP